MLTITQSPIPPGWFGITKPASLTELAAYLREQMKYFCEFSTKQAQMYWREVEKLNAQGCRYVERVPNPRYVSSNYQIAAFAVRQGLAWLREENVHGAPVLDVPERTPASITMDDLPKGERALASLIAFVERADVDGGPAKAVKGAPGRRGYPLEALNYARQLRAKHPTMKAAALRAECLKQFQDDDLPPDGESFRRWLNRKRANRAN